MLGFLHVLMLKSKCQIPVGFILLLQEKWLQFNTEAFLTMTAVLTEEQIPVYTLRAKCEHFAMIKN